MFLNYMLLSLSGITLALYILVKFGKNSTQLKKINVFILGCTFILFALSFLALKVFVSTVQFD